MVVFGLAVELLAFTFSFIASNREIEGLKNDNLRLQLELQPRIISIENVKKFIFLTHDFPKFPIRVMVGFATDETGNFAIQLRTMLNEAGYRAPDGDTNEGMGIHVHPGAVTYLPAIGDTNKWADVMFLVNNTNEFLRFNYISVEKTNDVYWYRIPEGDTNAVYGALMNAFSQIGITHGTFYKPDWMGTNQLVIFVSQKPQ